MTVDLLSNAAHPDAWHDVRSPGGYEWWYFDAEDTEQDIQFVAIFLDGFVFHPGYLRQHFRYLKNPTKHAPVRASDFPCAYLVVYEKGKLAAQFMTQLPPGSLRASRERPEVTLGDNTLSVENGAYRLKLAGTPWKLTGRGPQTLHGSTLSADWTLTPTSLHEPVERTFLSKAMTGADHHWVLAAPHSTFEASITLTGPSPRQWNLKGRAYHDHNYGTGPLGPGLKRWIWGRALFDDACYTFHYAVSKDPTLPPEPHLIRVTPAGVTDLTRHVTAEFTKRALGLAYPPTLEFDGVMRLTNPKVIDPTPFYLRLVYDAECEGRRGTAFCEVAYPHRLRWPVLGRMIEMSFDKRKG